MNNQRLFLSTCILALSLHATPVFAQEVPPVVSPLPQPNTAPVAPDPEAAAPDDGRLDEIVVTAQRREERLQDVPVSVTAFGAAAIEQLNLNDTLRTSQFVPGMVSAHNAGLSSANAFYLRGLGNSQSTPTFDAPVTTYVDDVYIARQNANNYAFFDTERVEVLRGPQGTLFGRNTTGGAINVIMRKPSKDFGVKAEATAGSYRRYTAKGTVDVPVTAEVLTKLSAYYVTDRGYLKNIVTGQRLNGEKNYGVRGDVRILAIENLTIDLSSDYTVSNGTYGPIRFNSINSAADLVPGANPFIREPITTTPAAGRRPIFYESASGLFKAQCDSDNIGTVFSSGKGNCNRSKTFALNANVAWEVGNGTINYIFGHRHLDQGYIVQYDVSIDSATDNPRNGFMIADNGIHKQRSHELKYNGDFFGDRFHLVTGIFYLKEESDDRQTNLSGGTTPANVSVDQHLLHNVKTAAIYAQADFDVTDALTLTAGARYTWERKRVGFLRSPLVSPTTGLLLGYTTADVTALGLPIQQTERRVTPRLAVNYKINRDVMLFASATNGFKSGGWNGNAPVPGQMVPFRPEVTWSYEAGVKSEFLNRRVRVNATGFYARTKDLQVTAGVQNPATGLIQQLPSNAGTLIAKGIEIESNFVISRDFSVFFNPAIIRGRYEDVPSITGLGGGTLRSKDDCATAPAGRNCPTEPTRMPKFQFAGGAIYETPVEALGGSLGANVTWRHNSPFWVAVANTTKTRTEDFIDAAISYKTASENTQLSFEVSNLTNEKTVTAFFLGLFPGDPRRFTARLRQRF